MRGIPAGFTPVPVPTSQPPVPPGYGGQPQGQPPAPVYYPVQQQPQPQGYATPPVQVQHSSEPSFSYPAPPAPQPQPQAQPQPQGWPAQPPYPQGAQPVPQAQPAPAGYGHLVGQDGRFINHPDVPQELRGRPIADGIRIYNVMREAYVRQQTTPQPQAQPNQPAPNQPPQGQPQAQPGQPQRSSFWNDPEGTIARVVDQRVQQHLGPVIENNLYQSAASARNAAAATVGQASFAALEGEITQRVGALPPEQMANPQSWVLAYEMALGNYVRQHGRMPAPGNAPAPQPNGNGTPQWQNGQPQTPLSQGGYQPYPQPGSFFTEAPTPPMGAQGVQGPAQLTAQQMAAAEKMGMRPEDYANWLGGRLPNG